MPNKTPIQWTDYSSNPIYAVDIETDKRGWHCVHVSEGCRNCYAEKINKRFGTGLDYTAQNDSKVEFKLSEKECTALRKLSARCAKLGIRKKVFLGDMLDIFHKDISDDILNELFSGTLEICASLTFQLLTKRIDRAREYLNWRWGEGRIPSRHIQIGTSVEDQPTADRRIVDLLHTRAVVRFLSVEPLLSEVDLYKAFPALGCSQDEPSLADIHWVIAGGESGAKARPCNLEWLRLIRDQCEASGVPCFVKQLGGNVIGLHENGINLTTLQLKDRKGGDINEFPPDLRVREFPQSF